MITQYKISIIGAGSPYTPVIFKSIHDKLVNKENILFKFFDIDLKNLNIITCYCNSLITFHKSIEIQNCASIKDVLIDSQVVITLYRSGGLKFRHLDETLPLEFDLIGQETQGFGGFASAFRNINVLRDISKSIVKYCPHALVINVTNPVGIMTRAANELGLSSIGLCELPFQMIKSCKELINKEQSLFEFDFFGLNHLGWITGIFVDGRPIIDAFIEQHLKELLNTAKSANIPISLDIEFLSKTINAIPCPYLVYYYLTTEMVNLLKQSVHSRAEQVMKLNKLTYKYYSEARSQINIDELIKQRGGWILGQSISEFLSAYITNGSFGDVIVCAKNNGRVDWLDNDTIIEATSNFHSGKKFENFKGTHIKNLTTTISNYENLVVEAALKKDKNLAFEALVSHPLTGDVDKTKKLFDKFMLYNKEFIKLN
jgi:6-phospho-beta-glucosidase